MQKSPSLPVNTINIGGVSIATPMLPVVCQSVFGGPVCCRYELQCCGGDHPKFYSFGQQEAKNQIMSVGEFLDLRLCP